MKPRKIIFSIVFFLFFPIVVYAADVAQEYVSADSNDSQNTNGSQNTSDSLSTQPAASIAPQSDQIYVLPAQQQANNTQPAVSQPENNPTYAPVSPQANNVINNPTNSYLPPAQPQTSANNNVNPMSNFQQNSLSSNMNNVGQIPVQSSLGQNVTNQAPAQTGASSGYTDQAKQGWLTNCISAITNKRVSVYAQEFCSCGWQHISSGELPPELLTSTQPADVKKRNSILAAISQQCLVDVMSKHNLK